MFWSVVLPMARPAVVTIIILSFQGSWNEYAHFLVATNDPALTTLTTLAASLVIGLAALSGGADADTLWNAANLEEDWQAELWGKDHEAEARRARRLGAFGAAMRFARLARDNG